MKLVEKSLLDRIDGSYPGRIRNVNRFGHEDDFLGKSFGPLQT